jgi:hypothetical protein
MKFGEKLHKTHMDTLKKHGAATLMVNIMKVLRFFHTEINSHVAMRLFFAKKLAKAKSFCPRTVNFCSTSKKACLTCSKNVKALPRL